MTSNKLTFVAWLILAGCTTAPIAEEDAGVACVAGTSTCACRVNGTCDPGLRCEAAACTTCPVGASGCACGAGNACGAGLACTNGTCGADTCVAGAVTCPCRPSGSGCDGTAYCDGNNRCQMCSPDVAGCPCSSTSTCLGGLACDMASMRCRAAVTCSQLNCAPFQLCSEGAGLDAVCVPGQCVAGYRFDAPLSSCVACVSPSCADEPTCAGDAGPACDAQNRVCTQSGASASCGACKPGFALDAQQNCVSFATPSCGATVCALDQFCDTSSGSPFCAALPCPAGQARPGTGACAVCTTPTNCSAPGYSGRYWPFQRSNGGCICETLDGYFQPAGGSGLATLCDADEDGWVREEADDSTVLSDPGLRANARCPIRRVDRVKLREEGGLTAEVHSCTSSMNLYVPQELAIDGGPVDTGVRVVPAGGASACGADGVFPLRLLETERNDVPGRINAGTTRAPVYGVGGRQLEAREVNRLTKACVSGAGDFNDNLVDDLLEVQGQGAPADDKVRLLQFGYFIELYTSFYEAPTTGRYGALVVQERERCDATGFPLRYDPAVTVPVDGGAPSDAFSVAMDAGSTYWRSCERRRDPEYNAAQPVAGFDFAQWTCASATGTCAFQQFPSATQVGPTEPSTTFFRDFGRCRLGAQQPRDQRWRGFGHHSQFKCVNVTTTNLGGVNVAPAQFGDGLLAFNECAAVSCSGTGGPACRSVPGAGAQTASPTLRCTPKWAPTSGSVGFAAVPYRPYGQSLGSNVYTDMTYKGGCITEDTESALLAPSTYRSYLCPWPEFSMVKARADLAFGRHSCYLRPANFLWSGPVPQRATLKWSAADAGVAMPNGVLR